MAGVRLVETTAGTMIVADVVHERVSEHGVEELVRRTAARDGRATMVRIEQEPGSSGKLVIARFAKVLRGYDFKGVRPVRDKVTRAGSTAAAAERGDFRLLAGHWNEAFVEELKGFPTAAHDDQVDAFVAPTGR